MYVTVPVSPACVIWLSVELPPVFEKFVSVNVPAVNVTFPAPVNSAKIAGNVYARAPVSPFPVKGAEVD